MAVLNASEVFIRISTDGGVSFNRLAFATDTAINTGHGTRDVTTKFSLGNTERAESKKEWNVSGSSWVVFSSGDDLNPANVQDLLTGRTVCFVEVTAQSDLSVITIVGEALVTAKSEEGGTEDNQSYSMQFDGKRYFGNSWAQYYTQRAAYRGATVEAISCMQATVTALEAIDLS